jgi:tRNA pseudouridine38-40 synthase
MVRRFCEVVGVPVDVAAMARAAESIAGVRDFKAFQGNAKRRAPKPGDPPRSTVRTVAAIVVREDGPFIAIDAFGRGFLYNMVRAIAGTLLEVGTRRRAAEAIEGVIASMDRRRAGITAPARGLCLVEVYYRTGEMESAIAGLRSARGGPGGGDGISDQILKWLI